MKDQMIRVISSPSISTMGFATLIFAMRRDSSWWSGRNVR
jgi:hypothetical protein